MGWGGRRWEDMGCRGSQSEAPGDGIRVQGHGGMSSRRWHELALPRELRLRGTLSKPPVCVGGVVMGGGGVRETGENEGEN